MTLFKQCSTLAVRRLSHLMKNVLEGPVSLSDKYLEEITDTGGISFIRTSVIRTFQLTEHKIQ